MIEKSQADELKQRIQALCDNSVSYRPKYYQAACAYIDSLTQPCAASHVEAAKRGPMSEEQIAAIVREAAQGGVARRDGTTSLRIVRAVEAYHGVEVAS